MNRTLCSLLLSAALLPAVEPDFVPLFDGKTLNGWTLVGGVGPGYVVKDGILICPADGGGNLFTEKEYANFIFRFEYRLSPGGNNGIGVRAPLSGRASYEGMEIQILDDRHQMYKGVIRPEQYSASVYGMIPARTGFQKPAGEWNEEEIMLDGRHVRVTMNGSIVIDDSLDIVREPEVLKEHPGVKRTSGHVGFLGHKSLVEFRNVRIKVLP
jgi:hypothetical protein